MARLKLLLTFTLAMFLPFGLIYTFGSPQPQTASLEGGLISFAIVILILRTAARAVFRDVFSASVKVAFRSFTRIFLSDITEGTIHREPKIWEKDPVAFTVSWLITATSLALVAYLQTGSFFPAIFPAVLLPFGAYILSQKALSKLFGAAHNMRLYVDGILLQAYFTGARSFLPITHENEIHGDKKACGLVVVHSNLVLFLLAASIYLLLGKNMWLDTVLLLLIVNTFPMKPMDGWYAWKWRKDVSLTMFAAALAGFAYLKSGFAGAIL